MEFRDILLPFLLAVRGANVNKGDVFILQFPDNAMDTGTFHSHTGSNRINTFVVGLHGHFRPFTGNPHDLLDSDQSVENLWNLQLKQTLQEYRRGPGKNDQGIGITHIHLYHNGTDGISFPEIVGRDLLGLGQDPGYLLIAWRNTTFETSLVAAVLAVAAL